MGRVYSLGADQFLQTDPVGYADDLNLYAYVSNDPITFIDPTGMQLEVTICGDPNTGEVVDCPVARTPGPAGVESSPGREAGQARPGSSGPSVEPGTRPPPSPQPSQGEPAAPPDWLPPVLLTVR